MDPTTYVLRDNDIGLVRIIEWIYLQISCHLATRDTQLFRLIPMLDDT